MIDSLLYVGDFDVLDGAVFLLRPQRTGPNGFTGAWRWDGGIEIIVDSAHAGQIRWGTRGPRQAPPQKRRPLARQPAIDGLARSNR
jgi:hypothetical protein